MRKALIYILLSISLVASAQEVRDTSLIIGGKSVEMEGAFLQPLQERDSVLIADQLLYGFELKGMEEGTMLALPEWKNDENGGVQAIGPWTVDTLKVTRQKKGMPRLMDIRGSMKVTSFDEGNYILPSIMVGRLSKDGVLDTLVFEPMRLEVKTMPVDTATFVPHDIKGQITYPLTFDEVFPYIAGTWLLAALVILAVCLAIMHKRKGDPAYERRDPAHIIALRKLDKYRGSKMWEPEKQKIFYSGVTDALREYISERYGISAMEMTTAEIFREMKSTDAPSALLNEVQVLFERADFVKFAKYVAAEEENASALPLAVRFVTETYQAELESEEEGKQGEGEIKDDGGKE